LRLNINIVERGLQWWQIRYAAERSEQHTLINARPQQTPHKPAGLWRERERERVREREIRLVCVSISLDERESVKSAEEVHENISKGLVQHKINQCDFQIWNNEP